MSLMELHGNGFVVSVVEQDAVVLRRGHLEHSTHLSAHVRVRVRRGGGLPHLQRDVSLQPVLDVLQLDVRVPVDEVDGDELLAALTLEARLTPAGHCPPHLHAQGAVLALGQLAG